MKDIVKEPISYEELVEGFPVYLLTDNELEAHLLTMQSKSIVHMTIKEREVYKNLRNESSLRKFDPERFDPDKEPGEFLEYMQENGLFMNTSLINEQETRFLSVSDIRKINDQKEIKTPETTDKIEITDVVMMIQFFRWLNTQKRYSKRLDTMIHYNSDTPVPGVDEYKRFLKTFFPLDLPMMYYPGFVPRTLRDIENEVSVYDLFRKTVFRKKNIKKGHFTINKACLLLSDIYELLNDGEIMAIADARFMLDRKDREHAYRGVIDSYITPFKDSEEKYLMDRFKEAGI